MVSKRPLESGTAAGAGRREERFTEQTVGAAAHSSMKNSQKERKNGEILWARVEEEGNKGGQRKGTMVDSFFAVGLPRPAAAERHKAEE